jgi:hypothetical protein
MEKKLKHLEMIHGIINMNVLDKPEQQEVLKIY